MARSHHLPPSAASLTASLRDLGYSLETAVADLIDNSISANATDIQIVCNMSRSTPVFVIADNGRGMAEDELRRALEGQRVGPDGKLERRQGLGIPLARQLVEAHGGKLEILSHLGEGTTVTITLP